jgi:hypothetical protein
LRGYSARSIQCRTLRQLRTSRRSGRACCAPTSADPRASLGRAALGNTATFHHGPTARPTADHSQADIHADTDLLWPARVVEAPDRAARICGYASQDICAAAIVMLSVLNRASNARAYPHVRGDLWASGPRNTSKNRKTQMARLSGRVRKRTSRPMKTILLATVGILLLAAADSSIPERIIQGTSGNGALQQSPRWQSLPYPACYSGESPTSPTQCRGKENAPWYWTRRV